MLSGLSTQANSYPSHIYINTISYLRLSDQRLGRTFLFIGEINNTIHYSSPVSGELSQFDYFRKSRVITLDSVDILGLYLRYL